MIAKKKKKLIFRKLIRWERIWEKSDRNRNPFENFTRFAQNVENKFILKIKTEKPIKVSASKFLIINGVSEQGTVLKTDGGSYSLVKGFCNISFLGDHKLALCSLGQKRAEH